MRRRSGSTVQLRAPVAGVTLVTAGSMVANIASYLLHVPASRWLGPLGYSEFAALLAAQLVLAVPALALQTVVARETVRGRSAVELRRLGLRCAGVVGVLAVAVSPAVSYFLETGVMATLAALVTAPMLVVLATEQGLLQGRSRFRDLAFVLAGSGLAKVVPAVVLLAVSGSAGAALVASAVGTALIALIARSAVGAESVSVSGRPVSWVSVLAASQVQLVVVGLSSLDLVLARAVLTKEDAGLYALGAVAAKAAFWLPQSVALVFYPRMSDPAQSVAAVRTVLAVLVGIGVVVVAGVASVLPFMSPLVYSIVGEAYMPVQNLLWVFAAQGAVLSVLQGALLSSVARERTRVAAIAWVGLAIEIGCIAVFASTPAAVLAVAVACAGVTTVLVVAVLLARSDRPRSGGYSRTY